MSDSPEAATLLGNSDRPSSKDSHHSNKSHEETPLLSQTDDAPRYDTTEGEGDEQRRPSPAASSLQLIQNGHGSATKSTGGSRPWPSLLAIGILGLLVMAIITGAFFVPAAVEEYAKESLSIEPTNLSIHNFTSTGLTARAEGIFTLDAARVNNDIVRRLGRFGAWVARKVETQPSTVEFYLPEYGNILLGTATMPRVVVDIRDGHTTMIDFLTTVKPGDDKDICKVAKAWRQGRLEQVEVIGRTNVTLKSGLFQLGSQAVSASMIFEGDNLPQMLEYNITQMSFREVPISPSGDYGVAADASLSVANEYPVKLTVPSLSFDILVPNCAANESYIRLADVVTDVIHVEPRSNAAVNVRGVVRKLPESLLQNCPHSQYSPLDLLLGDYIHGNDTTIFVRGSDTSSPDTPEWIANIMSSITIPVPFPGRNFDNLIKNFSVTDTHVRMPSPFGKPEDSDPNLSGTIVVMAAVPKEMDFSINVTRVRATADVLYKDSILGVLNLNEWQEAESERVPEDDGANFMIRSKIKDAPLNITDKNVFTEVLQEYLWGETALVLKVVALVDVEVSTVLGKLIVKDMPAEGVVPLKPFSRGGGLSDIKPTVDDIRVLGTTKTSVSLQARVNFTNPTEYTAFVPYFNIHILNNGSVIGDATARNVDVAPGNNTHILIDATWDPTGFGDEKAANISRELLSQYISGFNTTLTFQTHQDSIPRQPGLGKALSKFAITLPTPRIRRPGSGNGGGGNHKPDFISDATFHLFSSTAQFTLFSPIQHDAIYIETIDATAFYNHTEPVGGIRYGLPFKVPPGFSRSPKLPVDWSLGSVGYEQFRKALGGGLELDAKGVVGVRLGQWRETVWYFGSGIGATVRL